jgi:predicted PurR-regulated permease PerM
MNNNRWLQALIILLVFIATSWIAGQFWLLLIQFSGIILLFFLAWLLAFALTPIARGLQGSGVSQGWAVTVVYLAMLLVLVVVGLVLFPILADQIQRLIDKTPEYTKQLEQLGNQTLAQLKTWGVRAEDLKLDSFYGTLGDQVKNVGGTVLTFVSGLAGFLFNAIIILLLSFYFMKDGERMFNNAVRVIPGPLGSELQLLGNSVARAFGGFLRGQLVFAFLYGILNAAIMSIFGLDYVLIASILAGFAMVIPLVGGFFAYAPPLLIALVTFPTDNALIHTSADSTWWIMLIVLFVVQTIMMQVVSPRIMSQAIGMHPLFVVAALLIGVQVAGPWGALFGIPIAGVLHQVAGPYFQRLQGFFSVPMPEEPALALHGTTVPVQVQVVTVPPTPMTDAPAEGGTEGATPTVVLPDAAAPASGTSSALVGAMSLARGITRRARTLRRPRP